jgi:hypothetical protein
MTNDLFGDDEMGDLSQLLGALLVGDLNENTVNPQQETREYLIKYNAEEMNQAFSGAMAKIGDELNFSSAPYLMAGLFGSIIDGTYSIWDQVEKVVNSPLIGEMISEDIGQKIPLKDYIFLLKAKEQSLNVADEVEELTKAFEGLDKTKNYIENITRVSQESGKSQLEVLNTPSDMVGIIKDTYGSLDEYEQISVKAHKTIDGYLEMLEKVQSPSLPMLASLAISAKPEVAEIIDEIGLDINSLVGTVQRYASDVATFGKAYFDEASDIFAKKMETYRKVDSE